MYAIVTGASRGIGAAIARRLAADGYELVVNYRHDEAGAAGVVQAIQAAGGTAETCPFDVTDRVAARAALEALVAAKGAPMVVVVNAGITRDGLLAAMPDEDWDDVIATGLGGFYNVMRPLVQAMLMARAGRVVSIASTSGEIGNAGQVNYGAAKGGLIAATKSLARECAKRGVTANVVAPGLIDTAMTADLPLDRLLQAVPMRRLGTPQEVAHAMAFCCHPDAGYLTGQVIGVNGGLRT